MDSTANETAEEFQSSSVRRSFRKKVQTVHYGSDSPAFSSPQSSAKESQEQADESSEYKATDTNQDTDTSSDGDVPLSHYSPEKGKKRSGKTLKKQPSAKKTKASRIKSGTSFEIGDGHGSMFDIIRAGKGALQALADDWIESYNQDRISAMVDLIQFFITCCGCRGRVTDDMLEEEENVNAIRKLTEEFEEESDEYPLIMSGPAYKKFKPNFCEFIMRLIQQCQHSIVYDDFMMEKLISWLISLSDSQVRAFRHTSTLAGMKLVAALIQIATKVNVELDNTQRQLDSEKQKNASKRGMQKMEMLQNKKNQLRDNIREVEEFMSFIFQGIFVHRYRDIRPEIRSLCISEIGHWMKEYSSLFLSHKYLKYVVWTLHDKVGDVRLRALQSLLRLYEIEEFLPPLEPLTSRFKGRIVAMTLDKENDVAAEAIKLVTLLFRYGELDEEDCQQVEQLVFCNHRQVSHEAGSFLHERLLAEAESTSPSKKRASKKSQFQKNCEYMKRLVDFFVSSQIHNHASYLVDSLWQYCEILKDWNLMTSMLLDDASNEDLKDEDESGLIEIMTCCCRQAALGQGPPGRAVRRLLTTKEKKTIVNDKQEMSAHFMVQIPALLGKYGTDVPKAENLVTIPQYFELEEYTQRRLGKHFEDLLGQLDDLVQKGPEMPLLEECAKTYRTLTDNELTLRSKAEVALNKLMDNVVELFNDGYKNFTLDEEGDEEENAAAYAVHVNLKRITAFYKSHDLGAYGLYDTLYKLVTNSNSADEIISLALISMEMSLLWGIQALHSDSPNKRDMKTLKQRLTNYISTCRDLLEYGSREIQKQVFLCLCDTLVVFAQQLKNNYPLLSSLAYQATGEFQDVCTDFVIPYVFSDVTQDEEKEDEDNTEERVEELHNKRVLLAGFCKLIAYGIFEMKLASKLFSHMITGFGDYGDIIKYTMTKCKEINKTTYTKTIALTLITEFQELQEDQEDPERRLLALKDLAKRLSLTFGIDPSKAIVRTAMIHLHREAILFSFRPVDLRESVDASTDLPNLQFLEVINECTSRLIPQDKKVVLKYLQEEAEKHEINLNKLGNNREPLSLYHKALRETGQATGGKADKSGKTRPVTQKAKRKLAVEEEPGLERSVRKGADLQNEDVKNKEPEEEQAAEIEEISPKMDSPNARRTTENSQIRSKRKRDVRSDDSTQEDEHDSGDEFQESNSVRASSQKSWLASQPKRSANHARISYGKTKSNKTRRNRVSETVDEATKEDGEKRTNNALSPQLTSPPVKRTRRQFPENVFSEESAAQETQSDDDLDPAF